jgi:hypothetical protein
LSDFDIPTALAELIVMLGGNVPSAQQLALFMRSLEQYPPNDVREAFRETVEEDEVFKFARIVKRLRAMDGRPTAEAMWLEVLADESKTIWHTDESREALPQFRAAALSEAIDKSDRQQIAQIREAFKTDYSASVASARKQHRTVRWHESQGSDKDHRAVRMREAVELGRVTQERAEALLPHHAEIESANALNCARKILQPLPGEAQ